MSENIRIPYKKDRIFPVFEANIKDSWSITRDNAIGAEEKNESFSSYAPVGASPLNTTDFDHTVFSEDINNQLQTAMIGGNDSLRFTASGTITHNHIQLPDNFILETDSSSEVTIELSTVSPLYLDLGSGRQVVTLDSDLCGCPSINGQSLCVGSGGSIINIKRTNNLIDYDNPDIKDWNTSETIYALDIDIRNNYIVGILSNGANIDLKVDTDILAVTTPNTMASSVASVSTSLPKIRVLHVLDPDLLDDRTHVLVHKSGVTDEIIRYYYDLDTHNTTSGTLDSIQPFFESGDASTIRCWEVFSKGNMGNTLAVEETSQPLLKAMVLSTSYETYVYSSIEMQEEDLIEKLDNNLVTMVNFKDYKPFLGRVSFLGGRSIVKYDGRSFVTEYTFNIDRNSNITGHFFYHNNNENYVDTLYYVMTDDIKTIIVRRSDGGEWEEVFNSTVRLLPIESTRSSQVFLSDVIFKSNNSASLYMHVGENGGAITFGEDSKLNGFIIKNNDVLNYTSDVTTYGAMTVSSYDYSTSTASPEISYCSLYDTINKAGAYRVWNISNSIIKTEYESIVFTSDITWNYTGNCEQNVLKSTQKWALYIKDNYDFSGAVFLNNTISSLNGVYMNSDGNNPEIKNSIISATNFAVFNDNGTPYLTSYTLIYGRIQSLSDSYITGGGVILQVNPLFKDAQGGNYLLQHIGEDYPVNSSAIGTADPSGDRGAYEVTYVNNGEINSEGIELTNFDSDMIMSWIYPNLETTHDYTGNLLKYTGLRRRFITLSENLGNMSLKILYKLHKLYIDKIPLRFYPHGITGMQRFAVKTSFNDPETISTLHVEKEHTETLSKELSLYLRTGSFIYNEIDYEFVMDIPYIRVSNINIVQPMDSQPPYSNNPYIEVDTPATSDFTDIEGTDITALVTANLQDYINIGQVIEGDEFQIGTKIYDIETISPGVYRLYIDKLPLSTGAVSSLDLYDFYFDEGYLRGFYIEFEYAGNTYHLRIDENEEYRLYLKNTSKTTITIIEDFYDVIAPFIYVTINTPPSIREGLWTRNNQKADLNSIELTELEDKFEEQV